MWTSPLQLFLFHICWFILLAPIEASAIPDHAPKPKPKAINAVTVQGTLQKWHKITLAIEGPAASEAGNPNPFTDYRLEAIFRNGDKEYRVPGYFAADGNAAETSATLGNIWLVHFRPDTIGEWSYELSFRQGNMVAVSDAASAGNPVEGLDGLRGAFSVAPSDKTGRDNRAKGRLSYVGERYLQYEETGEFFLKGGPDSPENFLAYEDFDNTPNNKDYRKSWEPHQRDYQEGDPSWKDDLGTEIIGAINYLASKGLNSFSFLTISYQGDDRNVFPWADPENSLLRYDVSKLAQWEIVFDHADNKGMYLHFKMQETENDELLDGGALGPARKLYIRELIARFGHHLALNWNLGEENTQTTEERRAMAQYIRDIDPYDHHIVVHSYPRDIDVLYPPLLGDSSVLTGMSLQHNYNKVHEVTEEYIRLSKNAGKPWVVANDEQGPSTSGVPPDTDWPDRQETVPTIEQVREQCLWGNLMAGGGGVEYYFGYQQPESDVLLNDYRSRDDSWTYVAHALNFFRAHVPFHRMESRDNLIDDGYCLARQGEVYLAYFLAGGVHTLELVDDQQYRLQWFNPRQGGDLQIGTVEVIRGPGTVSLGQPPNQTSQDWAVLIERMETNGNIPPVAVINASSNGGPSPQEIQFDASASNDPDGTIVSYTWGLGDGTTASGPEVQHTFTEGGIYDVVLTVTDDEGFIGVADVRITVTVDNELPVPLFTYTPRDEPESLTVDFDATESFDPDGGINSFSWEFGDGGTATGRMEPHTYPTPGSYDVTLTVRDDDFATVSLTKTITVGEVRPTEPPVAAFTVDPEQGTAPLTVNVDASESTDADGTIVNYAWDYGDGATGSGQQANHTYTSAGNFTIILTVTDDAGATDQTNRTVLVEASEQDNEQLTSSFTADPESGVAPLLVQFDGSASVDPDGRITAYRWDYGDGNSASGPVKTHTFTEPGIFVVTFSVRGSDGEIATASKTITVIAENEPNSAPTASATATPDQGIAPLEVAFDATASSDTDGRIIRYDWDFGNDNSSNGQQPNYTFTEPGIYEVTLVVTDDEGATDEATLTITVEEPINQAPVARFTASPASGTAPLDVAFDAAASSDPDGRIVEYAWSFGDGTTASGPQADHTFSEPGTYEVTLTVTDNAGATDQNAQSITVEIPENQAPTAVFTATPTSGVAPLPVSFDASGSGDSDGRIVSYVWNFGDGTMGGGIQSEYTYSAPGTYEVALTVVDNEGATDQITTTITVAEPDNQPPRAIFTASPPSGVAPLDVNFDAGSSSDSDGSISNYAWDFGDGNTGAGARLTHTYTDPGAYEVVLTVTDDDGATSETTQIVSVDPAESDPPQAPTLTASFIASPEEGTAPLLVEFDGRLSSDPDGQIVAYRWNFGNTALATGPTFGYTYEEPGTYVATLEVQDNDGNRSTATKEIRVLPPGNAENTLPVAEFSFLPTGGPAPLEVFFNAERSEDPDGTIVSYHWEFGDGGSGLGERPSYVYQQPGTYSILLTVVDNEGGTGQIVKEITIDPPIDGNQSPVADFTMSPSGGVAPLNVTFNGRTSYDVDGRIVAYVWDFGDGTSEAGNPLTNRYTEPGTYTIVLTVRDNNLDVGTTVKTLVVADPNPPANEAPVAQIDADPISGPAPLTVNFDGSGSTDADGEIRSYQWVFGQNETAEEAATTFTFDREGTYVVLLTVTDEDGATHTTNASIEVGPPDINTPPNAVLDADQTSGPAPLSVQFDATASTDSDGEIVSYFWDFDDGNTDSTASTLHTFESVGTFEVLLMVTDNEGGISTRSIIITVEEAENLPPVANFSVQPERGVAPLEIDFDASASTDPDGTIVSYEWDFGDGNAASGNPATHVYEVAGSYSATLTVTDDDGATHSISHTIEVTESIRDCSPLFVEEDGLLVIEMESAGQLPEGWEVRNEIFDPTGGGYLLWTGQQFTQEPGGNAVTYQIQINNPGVYRFDWRVAIGTGTSRSDHNDTWLYINADRFYGERYDGSSVVRPQPDCEGDPTAECPRGKSAEGYFKIYGGSLDQFEWRSLTSDGDGHFIYARFDQPGIYEIKVDARSNFHLLDRMVLHREDLVGRTQATQIGNEEYRLPCSDDATSDAEMMAESQGLETSQTNHLSRLPGSSFHPSSISLELENSRSGVLIDLFPNPTNDAVQITLSENAPVATSNQLLIIDLSGKVVFRQQAPNRQTSVNLSHFPTGVYLVRYQTETAVYQKRLIRQ